MDNFLVKTQRTNRWKEFKLKPKDETCMSRPFNHQGQLDFTFKDDIAILKKIFVKNAAKKMYHDLDYQGWIVNHMAVLPLTLLFDQMYSNIDLNKYIAKDHRKYVAGKILLGNLNLDIYIMHF